jgi:hypothetical protein
MVLLMRRWPVRLGVLAAVAALPLALMPAAVGMPESATTAGAAVGTAALPRATVGRPIPAAYVGMHLYGPDNPSQRAIFGSQRTPATTWEWVELSRGQFTWTDVDRQVRLAQERGVPEVLFVLGGTPGWAAGPNLSADRNSPTRSNPPADVADWDTYIAAVATHLRGSPVQVAYQVWNEANLTTFFNGTPEQMAELTARAYRIIKQIDPRAIVVGASTTTRLTSAYLRFFPRYLQALAQRGWPVDALSAHTYPPSTGGPADFQRSVRNVRAAINAAGGSRKPLWITEMNYGLAGPGPKYPYRPIGGTTAAAWVARTYLDGLRLGVARLHWYSQFLEPSLGIQMWAGYPGLTAQRSVATWLRGARWVGCSVRAPLVRCSLVLAGGSPAQVAWSEGTARSFTAPSYAVRACNPLGQCTRIRGGRVVRANGLPVLLRR